MEQFSRRALGVSALYGLLSILFCLPLFARPFGLGAADWDRQLFYFGEVLKNVVEYRQAPFWSPWHCGGNVMWQHPSVPLLSPVYLLVAIMPLALAVKVNIVLHYWIGLLGMHWLLTRAVRLTFLPLVVTPRPSSRSRDRWRSTSPLAIVTFCRRSICRGCCTSCTSRFSRGGCARLSRPRRFWRSRSTAAACR